MELIVFKSPVSKLGVQLIHISTDHLFDGKKSTAYIETDYVNPLNNLSSVELPMGASGLASFLVPITLSKGGS